MTSLVIFTHEFYATDNFEFYVQKEFVKRNLFYKTFMILSYFFSPSFNKTKDWALVQNAALVTEIKVLKLG